MSHSFDSILYHIKSAYTILDYGVIGSTLDSKLPFSELTASTEAGDMEQKAALEQRRAEDANGSAWSQGCSERLPVRPKGVCVYMYTYIYIYICVCVSLHTYTNTHMYTHIHVYVCMCIYVYIYTWRYTTIHTDRCMCVHIYTYTYTYVYVYRHMYICICIWNLVLGVVNRWV